MRHTLLSRARFVYGTLCANRGKDVIIQTRHTRYVLEDQGDGVFLISGSAKYCLVPTPVRVMETPHVGGSLRWVYEDHKHSH